MRTNIEVTFDDLTRMLRSLAHDLADKAEAGYLRRYRIGERFDGMVDPVSGRSSEGESHDGAGR